MFPNVIPSAGTEPVGSRLPLKTRLHLDSYRIATALCLSAPWGTTACDINSPLNYDFLQSEIKLPLCQERLNCGYFHQIKFFECTYILKKMLPWGFWRLSDESMEIMKCLDAWSYLMLKASITTTVHLTEDNSSGNSYEIIQDELHWLFMFLHTYAYLPLRFLTRIWNIP